MEHPEEGGLPVGSVEAEGAAEFGGIEAGVERAFSWGGVGGGGDGLDFFGEDG